MLNEGEKELLGYNAEVRELACDPTRTSITIDIACEYSAKTTKSMPPFEIGGSG